MGLNLNAWNALSTKEKNDVVNFLKENCKIDREHPERMPATQNSYPIKDGTTSGGHDMKFGEEYRIYVRNISGIPLFLERQLRERGEKNRIGGSNAIKAIMAYANFRIGDN